MIGIAGTGRMGTAIALRLLDKGHEVVVWNRTRQKTEIAADAGAIVAPTPAVLVSACDKIISSLTNAAAMRTVYTGRGGLLSGDAAGKLFIEMSTVRAADHRALMTREHVRIAPDRLIDMFAD